MEKRIIGINNISAMINDYVPKEYYPYLILIAYVILIVFYSIFVWKLYKFIAKKNIIDLNLNKYNKAKHPILIKFLALMLFLLEYIIIIPILIFFWFSAFAVFLLLLSKNTPINQILVVSAAIVGAIRMTSYYSNDLSKDLAKIFPFTVLVVSLLDPQFLANSNLIYRVLEIPALMKNIILYIIFIAGIEFIMRILLLTKSLFKK